MTLHGALALATTFGLVCPALNINTQWTLRDGAVQTSSGMAPSNFNGGVITWATVPGSCSTNFEAS